MHLDFKGGWCSPNPPKIIGLITVTNKTFTKGVNGEKTIFFELSLANIRSGDREDYRLEECNKIVEIIGEILI